MWNIDLVGEMVRLERARRVPEAESMRPLGRRRRRDGRIPAAEAASLRRERDPQLCEECGAAA
jgi:hypothetical protein